MRLELWPRHHFDESAAIRPVPGGLEVQVGGRTLGFWSSHPAMANGESAHASFRLREGEEAWAVLTFGEPPAQWSTQRAQDTLAASASYWREWLGGLSYAGPRADRVKRSALLVHLLSYAPAGSLVAAPTTSLPERLGGDRNYDYRFAWIRDASLSLASLALLGDTVAAAEYMDWLAALDSSTDSPLQVLYGIDGRTDLSQHEREDLAGYRGSRPVRLGNHAFRQHQLDSLGYLADCALIFQQSGGTWRAEYWEMIRRVAEYAAGNWRLPDSGIWELSGEQHYVSSKVMSWVTLERAAKLAEAIGNEGAVDGWRRKMAEIHAEVMERGWSERLGAFRQRYEAETLDASVLLIAVMDFLPADHPRVLATAERIVEHLTIDGFVHRFIPRDTLGGEDLLVGEFEGAFLPCTFWLATTYAKAGRPDLAEEIVRRAERVAGVLGLFAEEIDARAGTFLGNSPLLFSLVKIGSGSAGGRPLHPADWPAFSSVLVGPRPMAVSG